MIEQLNAHAQELVREFKIPPTKPRKGKPQKGIRFTLLVRAYADGKVELVDDDNRSQTHEMFNPDVHPERVFLALCERASQLARELPTEAQP